MSQGKKPTTATVLLIEADASLRRLIALGLQQRGLDVVEASSFERVSSSDMERLDLLLIDVDGRTQSDHAALQAAQMHPILAALPLIVLAWEDGSRSQTTALSTTTYTCLAKPFDARILHTTIDKLLSVRAAVQAEQEAHLEEVLLASYKVQAAPSVWPIVTAAGLLLIFVGLLFQLTILLLGILIVIAALLQWTLGTKPAPTYAPVT